MDSIRDADDLRRLDALRMLDLLRSDPDPALDRLTRIAASVVGADIALISFSAGDSNWIRSHAGRLGTEACDGASLRSFALDGPGFIEVPDATQDARFADKPWVRGDDDIRSCAAQSIRFEGLVVGTVCVLDARPRRLGNEQRALLADIAGMVEALLELRHKQVLLRQERQHAVELATALGESEAMLAQAQRVARMGSWEGDVETGTLTWSAEMYALLQRDPHIGPMGVDELGDRIHPADHGRYEAIVDAAFVRHQAAETEFRFRMPDGSLRWIHAVSEPVPDVTGRVVRLRGTVQDVSERKKAERLVQESVERDRLLWQSTTDAVLTLGEDSRIRFCNPAVADLFGYQPEELVGQSLALLQPERLRAAHRHGLARYIASGTRRLDWRAVETIALHRDGREFPVEISFSDMQVEGQRLFGAFMRDITQRVRQSQALQRNEELYRRIVETAEEGIWMIDENSVTTFVNPKMARMLGYGADEMLGRSLFDFMDDRARAEARANVRRREQGISEQHDFRLRRRDGSDLWTAMTTSATFDDQGRYLGALAMVTDISERRDAEDALRQSEERFRSLTALSSDWYWEQDDDFRLIKLAGERAYENHAALRRVTGLRPWESATARLTPNQWAEHRAMLDQHLPFRDFEVVHEDATGAIQTVSISGEPVFDDAGVFTGYRGVGRNITEQRRNELARLELEAQLRESQKMEAIGALAGGIAHDFNNVLAGILGNVALALQDLPAADAAVASLEQIRKASLRGRGLVQQILAFARRQPREMVSRDLGPLVVESVGLLRATLPAGVTLEVALSEQPVHVLADATQIEQVLMNLCTNAWHSLAGSPGRVSVSLDATTLDGDSARALGLALPPGDYARLAVQDNGRGMSAETRARIFEPFFTTKPLGEGTGLGLAVAHGIVAAHGGAIRVETAEGQGSLFQIFLPRSHALPAAERATPRAEPHRGHGERVLYVDDDEVMAVMVERLLERLGYVVTCLDDPAAAIEALSAAPRDFDIVVTDLNMPGLSGLDVARAIRALRADLPVVISSGNLPDQLQGEAREAGVRALVHKQYTLEELGPVIHWVLAGGQRLGLEPLLPAIADPASGPRAGEAP